MNTNRQLIAGARARIVLMILAALVVLAAAPGAALAQSVVRVPPVRAQVPPVPPVPAIPPIVVPQIDIDLEPMLAHVPRIDSATLAMELDAMRMNLADLEGQQARTVIAGRAYVLEEGTAQYESGLSAIDNEQWQRAIERFDRVIKTGKARVDGATYWKAYALYKLGQRSEALTALQDMQKAYPNSRWLDDARALEIEVRKSAGQPVKPEDQANEELKLLALTSVMQADPERGIPALEQMIKGHDSPKVKQRALFLLSTSDSQRARDVLANIARGGGNPDLQLKAIRYLGIGRRANTQLLADVYGSTKDEAVKREIIRSLMLARDVDHLLAIAKTEPSPELRSEAIRQLGVMKADNQLVDLLSAEKQADLREQIFRSLAMSGNAERAAEMAKQEADAKVRASAVRNLGMTDSKKTGDALVQIYKTDKDQGVKKAVINALYMQQNAKALVDLARQETDASMKKEIVSRLSTMKSKEATDYMLELLK